MVFLICNLHIILVSTKKRPVNVYRPLFWGVAKGLQHAQAIGQDARQQAQDQA